MSNKNYKGVRLTLTQENKLKELAKERDINLSEAIRYVIDYYFDNLNK